MMTSEYDFLKKFLKSVAASFFPMKSSIWWKAG